MAKLMDAETDEEIGTATAAQVKASLAAGETGIILVSAEGDVVADGSWDAQQPGVRRVYVMDARVRVIVNTESSFSGGSLWDGLTQETKAQVERLDLADALVSALSEAHLAAWKAALVRAGYEPYEINEWEIDTEVARGHGFSRDQIVDWEELDYDTDPFWQEAWDQIDSDAITRKVIADAIDG